MSGFSRELPSFVEIAPERSIRRAADKLNVASSALSRLMCILECDPQAAEKAEHRLYQHLCRIHSQRHRAGKAVGFLTWFDVCGDGLAGRLGSIRLADKRLTKTLCVCVSGALPLSWALAALVGKTAGLIARMYENG